MKKIITLILTVFSISVSYPQNNKLPPGRPGQLPVPENPRLLTPPDLRVEELSLVSVTRNSAIKKINVQVLMRIKNFGELRCGNSVVLAYMKSPAGSGTTRTFPVSFGVMPINPGESFVKVYTFQYAEAAFRPGTFDFWIKADARNAIVESDETNNTSTVINIAVPAS